MSDWTAYGERKLLDTFNDGGNIAELMQQFAQDWETTPQHGELLLSAVGQGLRIIEHAKGEGYRFDPDLLQGGFHETVLSLNRLIARREWASLSTEVKRLANALQELRKAMPKGTTLERAQPAPAPRQQINIHLKQEQAQGPQEVKVISLPERQTESVVERDASGNIVKTTQTERDAA